MSGVDVKITDNSDQVRSAVDEAMARALEAIGQQAEGYAKPLCPADTGRLRNSITHTFSGNVAFESSYTDSFKKGTKGQTALKNSEKTNYSHAVDVGGKLSDKTVYVGSAVEYAAYVEYGTSKTKAQPFLQPAVMDHIDEYRRIAESELKKG